MHSKKILIITYYWPPSGGVGVQRWMNFALQLKAKGWEPMILTPQNPQFEIKDEKQLEVVSEIFVKKIPIWEPFNFFHNLTGGKEKRNVQQGLVLEKSSKSLKDKFAVWLRGNLFVPDPRVFWIRKASKAAVDLIQNQHINFLITTGPPHSIHLIGRKVKRKTGIRWMADFRDPWSKWDILQKLKTTALVRYIHRSLENAVLKEADVVTTVSKRLAKSLGDTVEVLNNGLTIQSTALSNPDTNQFTIGYFGMLNELRNPSQLWMVLDQLCREDEEFSNQLQIRIGGIVSESIKEELSKLERLRGKVTFLGYLPHEQMLKEYQRCNMLLLLLNKSDNSKWILPVKFFEYLAANRMILCLGPKSSDLGDLMYRKEIGEIFAYSDIQQIRAFILANFSEKAVPDYSNIKTLLDRFSHETLVNKLEELITKR